MRRCRGPDRATDHTVNSKEDAVFFELYDEDTAGWRPPGPQGRIQRHTVEQIIETFVPVQALDVLLPQLAEQLVDVPTPSSHESSITRKKRVILARYSDATGHWFQCTGPQGSLLVAVGHRPHPADPPEGDHHQPRAVNKHWASCPVLRSWSRSWTRWLTSL